MKPTAPPRCALVAVLVLAAGCKTSDPPEVVCPQGAGDPVPMCGIAGAELVVEATVEAWAGESKVLDLTGFPDTVVTPVALQVSRSLKGSASGRLDVLFVGCIGDEGSSVQGPLQTAAGKSEGYFFVMAADGYAVVVPQGFFRREGGLLKNAGEASEGITEAELFERARCDDAGL